MLLPSVICFSIFAFSILAFSSPTPNGVPPHLSGIRPGANPHAVTGSDPNDPSYIDDGLFQTEMMVHHNRLRREHGVKELVWDNHLADVSRGICATCVYEHSHAARNGGPYGENIAAGYKSVRDTCYHWGESERAEYGAGYGAGYDNPTYNSRVGHFTQMIWASTERVGCARRKCVGALRANHESWFVVCEYSPRGNILNPGYTYFRANVLRPV